MANILPIDKKIAVISNLVEGASIRSVERITGIHRDTIMRLGVKVGETCSKILDEECRGLNSTKIQVDEIWGYVGKKARNCLPGEIDKGDVWTWVAVDAETKLVPCFTIGGRTLDTARAFVNDLAPRLNNRVQISSDGLSAYIEAIKEGFGYDVDYGQIVKTYTSSPNKSPETRYSPGKMKFTTKKVIEGNPDSRHISTSYIERQNLTIRMHNRRMTRLTNAFSKKIENFSAAMALHFAYYNFVKRHGTLRCTPAMAAGIADGFWSVGDLVEMAG